MLGAVTRALGLVMRTASTRTLPFLISVWAIERVLVIRQKYIHLSRRWLWISCGSFADEVFASVFFIGPLSLRSLTIFWDP